MTVTSAGQTHEPVRPPLLAGLITASTVVILLILFRSGVFVWRPQLYFDADQAISGLMGKHLSEGRAFPLFVYGQSYILGVQSWLAAISFTIFGVSPVALKLPLLLTNTAIGLLLVVLLQREIGLAWALAVLASVFFLLAPPGTTASLLETSGGNVEPFLYILLLWLTRRRPGWFGLILGVGFLQREFTIYGALAIVIIEVVEGAWRRPEDWQRAFRALRVAAEVWLVVQFLKRFATGAGPGTSAATVTRADQLFEPLKRLCVDPASVGTSLLNLATLHWPRLFGTQRVPVVSFGLESDSVQGLPWAGLLLAALMILLAARVIVHARASRAWWARYRFCAFLVLVGLLSAAGLAVGRCGGVTVMRFDLLSLVGAVGLSAWGLAVETRPLVRRLEIALIAAWAAVSIASHAQIWVEYSRHPRPPDKQLVIRHLDARGIRYATADYWIAYYVTFWTNERIIVAATDFPRILAYNGAVDAHRAESVLISRRPCSSADVRPVIEGVYFCPPP
jgi:hypothetical protein